MRVFLKETLREASVDRIEFERGAHQVTITIHSGKPGFIIGRCRYWHRRLKKKIAKKILQEQEDRPNLNVVEIQRPGLSSNIVLQNMIADIEKRLPFRRVWKQTIDRTQKSRPHSASKSWFPVV